LIDKCFPFVRGYFAVFVAIRFQKDFGISLRVMGLKFVPFDDPVTVLIHVSEWRVINGEGSTGDQKRRRHH